VGKSRRKKWKEKNTKWGKLEGCRDRQRFENRSGGLRTQLELKGNGNTGKRGGTRLERRSLISRDSWRKKGSVRRENSEKGL